MGHFSVDTAIVATKGDKKKLIESKKGPTAKLTENQEKANNAVNSGQPLIPKGNNAARAGLTPGNPVRFDEYQVDRHPK